MKKLILVVAGLFLSLPCFALNQIAGTSTSFLPYSLGAAEGLINGATAVHIVARNNDIDTSAEDLVDNGANFQWPTTAKKLQIVSTSAKDIGGKKATGTLTVVDYNQMLGSKKSATITFTGQLTTINGKRITVNGNNLTENTQWHNGNTLGETATAFAAAVNAMTNGATFSATSSSNIVTIQYDTNGDTTGALTLATNDANGIVLSSSTLSGGEDLLTLTVNGRTFIAGATFVPTTSNAATAAAIAAYLNANGAVSSDLIATSSGRTVTLTAAADGTYGNSITTSSNDSDSLTAAASTLLTGKADVNGANLITIKGLNGGYLEQSEDVIINGTGFATTVNTYIRLNDAYVSEAGSNGWNIGTISIKQNGTNMNMAKFGATENRTYNSTYTVPKNKTAYLTGYGYSIMTASPLTTADLELKSRPYGGVFTTKEFNSIGNGNVFFNGAVEPPIKFTGRSDIIMRGSTGANNTFLLGLYDLLQIND